MPLQYSNSDIPGTVGAVRLRYSLTFFSDRERLVRYFVPMERPRHYIPFLTKRAMINSSYVLRGRYPDTQPSVRTLLKYHDELWEAIDDIKEILSGMCRNLLFWYDVRSGLISFSMFVWWQFLVSYPKYLPSSVPMLLLSLLADQRYAKQASRFRIAQQPNFYHICLQALNMGNLTKPLTVEPARLETADANCSMLDEAETAMMEWWRPPKERQLAQKLAEARLGYGALDVRPRPRTTRQTGEIEAAVSKLGEALARKAKHASIALAVPSTIKEVSVREVVKEGALPSAPCNGDRGQEARRSSPGQAQAIGTSDEAPNNGHDGAMEAPAEDFRTVLYEMEEEVREHFEYYLVGGTEGTKIVDQKASKNPPKGFLSVYTYLGPVQNLLRRKVQTLRSVRRFLKWQDRILTTEAVFALLAVTIVLALIPWDCITGPLLRFIGLAIFGPHMYFVGRYLERRVEAEYKEERAYLRASVAQRRDLLRDRREGLMAAAQKRAEAAFDAQGEGRRAVTDYLRDAPHVGVVDNFRTSAPLKYPFLPDPYRSRAYPTSLPQKIVDLINEEDLSGAGPYREAQNRRRSL